MRGTFLSVDGHALALGVLFDEDVVSQVQRLQCKACGEQPKQGDVGESRAHGPHLMRSGARTLHST
ncbi:MAG: hypothetical protein F4Z28_18225 [Gammaproteobacteria bacterium]|nr:hypothetical protein [Gammaproteobacteria bacterium]